MTTNTTENTTADGDGPTPVAILGLGLMGHALASAFLDAGHPTTVCNRTPAKAEVLVARGAALAATPADAVMASPLIIVCVADYDAVHEILDPLTEELTGRVLVNLTSGSSRGAREVSGWAAARGVAYLDGAILAAPQGIGTDDATILYSGDRSAFDTHEAELRTLAGRTNYLGNDPGLASLHDVAVLTMMWSMLNAYLHATALLGKAGIRARALTPVIEGGIGTVTSWLAGYAEQIDDGSHPGDDSTIRTHRAAMDHLIEESELGGVDTDLPRSFKAIADRAVAAGHGDDGYAAIIELFRSPA